MKLLWSSWFCPKECDRKKVEPPKKVEEPPTEETDDDVDCQTHTMDPSSPACPQCNSLDTDPFAPNPGALSSPYAFHCWTCGDMW